MKRCVVLFLLLWCACLNSMAQTDARRPVLFTCKCDDGLSRVFAYAMRDLFAKSPRYREATLHDGSNVFRIGAIAEVVRPTYAFSPLLPNGPATTRSVRYRVRP